MRIQRVPDTDKLAYRELLLLADEQWSCVEEYLDAGEMWVAAEGDETLGVCVVLADGSDVVEVANLAVAPEHQRQGVGRALVDHVRRTYGPAHRRLRICTGDSPLTVPFYESCGLRVVERVPGYLTEHYDHPIYEGGQLISDLAVMELELELS